MDLREVLAEWLHENHCACGDHRRHPERYEQEAGGVLRRLSQPDVLDEFERRVKERYDHGPEGEWTGPTARRVLADMLGGSRPAVT